MFTKMNYAPSGQWPPVSVTGGFVYEKAKGKKWTLRLYGELSENRADGIIRHETLM